MGFEKKLLFTQTSQTERDIQQILENRKDFYKKESIDNCLNFEFKVNKNEEGMPDVTALVEEDGLYVCQHRSPETWDGIIEITGYLTDKNLSFKLEEL